MIENLRKHQSNSGRKNDSEKLKISPKAKIISIAFAAILFWSLISISHSAQATTYYISNSGSDSANGTSEQTSWKNIAKVNSINFQPGDSVLFKKGDIWREQLDNFESGTSGNPITYGSYGTGAKPIISGSDAVTGWSNYSGNIYVASVDLPDAPAQLLMDGQYYDIAHYPNSGWLTATSNSTDNTSIIDANLTLQQNQIVGATVMAKSVDWYIGTAMATAYDISAHKITLSGQVYPDNSNIMMRQNWGYYLQNMLWMLDAPGEWFYDSTAHKLYVWMPDGGSPTGHTIETSSRDFGIRNFGAYITIDGLTIENANANDIVFSGGSNCTISNLDISGGPTGMMFYNSPNTTVSNNFFQNTLGTGISFDVGNHDDEISNNTVANNGNVGTSPKNSGASISIVGTAMTVQGNTITNSGSCGIGFNGRVLVKDNNIDNSCLHSDDCGGIYTGEGGSGSTIEGNVVTNTIGNASGTDHTGTASNGIYLDDLSHDYNVLNNTVSNADRGIMIHTGYNNTVTGNTVIVARQVGLLINRNTPGAASGTVHDNIVNGNIFEYVGTGATASYYDAMGADTNFGAFDYNQYYHPNSDIVVSSQFVDYTLSVWQNFSGQDLHSTDSKSVYNPTPIYSAADINQDSYINLADFNLLKSDFLKLAASLSNPRSDINGDGQATIKDVGILMSGWKP